MTHAPAVHTAYTALAGYYDDGSVYVLIDGQQSGLLPLRLDIANKSPTGFAWGYGGSGPAQLAIALIAHATGDDRKAGDARIFQRFKAAVIQNLDQLAGWTLTKEEILDWVRKFEAENRAGGPVG